MITTSIQGVDSTVVASREVLSVTVAALAAPATTNPPSSTVPSSVPAPTAPATTPPATTAPTTAPTTTDGAPEPPSFSANEMQRAPTTTAPPTTVPTTTVLRFVAPPTTAGAPTFQPASTAIPLNAAAAAEFTSRTNGLRASLGLAPLGRNGQLDAYAAAWARELAAAGKLSHSSSPEAAIADGWSSAGENVGFGSSVGSVHDALVSSAGHYANLARPSYTAIGVAVAVGADGRLWLCEVFAG